MRKPEPPRFLVAARLAGLAIVVAIAIPTLAAADSDEATQASPRVKLETSMGAITLELDRDKAPKSVENFLQYVEDGSYDGTIFHRVIADFMIQGGGFDVEMEKRETREPIQNEADNGLKNLRGSVAMARTGDPHSASSQFFINVKDNPRLDHRAKDAAGWGYAVFGRVVEGMDVVDAIRAVETGICVPNPLSMDRYRDCPDTPIEITRAKRVGAE